MVVSFSERLGLGFNSSAKQALANNAKVNNLTQNIPGKKHGQHHDVAFQQGFVTVTDVTANELGL